MGRRDETGLHTDTVGWTLEAAPLVGPAFAYPDNSNLEPFAFAHGGSDTINLALGALDDPGLLADIDRHQALVSEEATLRVHEKELTQAWFCWRNNLTPVRQRLIAAQACTCLHPYFTNQIPLPANEHCPEGVTIADALLLHHRIPHFHLPMPWLAREERLSVSRWVQTNRAQSHVSKAPTSPARRTNPTTVCKCPHCKVPNAPHASIACPVLNCCYYCKSLDHHANDCPCPHTNCWKSRLGCFIPYLHKNNRATHCAYAETEPCDTQANDQEDMGHYDKVDWEATSGKSN